ncbi:MAG TPA: hypothetical protein DIT01_20285 [Lentisphaeria bacterium]|nr:hypothetical protein [Lentisphaeria bacterium]
MTTRLLKTIVSGIALLCLSLSTTHAQCVIYSEDFEGGGDPQNIQDAPFSYIKDAGLSFTLEVASGTGLTGRAVDGATGGAGNILVRSRPIDNIPYPDLTQKLTLTADVAVSSVGMVNDSGIGLAVSSLPGGIYTNHGAFIFASNGFKWNYDFRGLMGNGPGAYGTITTDGYAEIVLATIEIDYDADTVTASITHSGGTDSVTQNFPAGAADGIDRFAIQLNGNLAGYGVDVDNIEIESTLVPSVVYCETFEGGDNGQDITDAPFGYSKAAGLAFPMEVNSSTPLTTSYTLAVDGDSPGPGKLLLRTKNVAIPTGIGKLITNADLTQSYFGPINDSYIGLAKAGIGAPFNDSGAHIGAAGTRGGWVYDFRGIGGTSGQLSTASVAEIVEAEIEIDYVNSIATARLTHSGGTDTHSESFPSGGADTLDRVVLLSNGSFGGYGLDVDNILIRSCDDCEGLASAAFDSLCASLVSTPPSSVAQLEDSAAAAIAEAISGADLCDGDTAGCASQLLSQILP